MCNLVTDSCHLLIASGINWLLFVLQKTHIGCTLKGMTANPPRAQSWEVSHKTNAEWVVDHRADHNNLPGQEPVNITKKDI